MSTALPTAPMLHTPEPSPEFKSEVKKSIFAIVAFIVVYVVLFVLALALVAASVYAGAQLIANFPRLITIIIGAGLMGLGVMVFFFLVKFLFDTNKADVSGYTEISAADQPELVAFIHGIAKETRTFLPKKIFISQDVNASVFYNSSFWSMFLPVKKNLMIGLGLVNAVNVSEFKAVVAHEFGHFSQRSMKLGSFVYNVNHIIFNMLYKNNGYSKGLQGFASVHGVFYFFAQITVGIVQLIQSILRQMYKLVNLSYLGLSRQMEFHADLVAATTAGSNNIISALQKIELADQCYHTTLATYDKLLKENKRAINFYDDHQTVYRHFTESQERVDGVGNSTGDDELVTGPAQRVNIKNQWASHPTTPERKAYLEPFNLAGAVDENSAWSLISNAEALKTALTNKFYEHIGDMENKAAIDAAGFEVFYKGDLQHGSLPGIFGSYYDNRAISSFDLQEAKQATVPGNFEQLFTPETNQLPKTIEALNNDISLLKAIDSKEVDTRSFDFDGNKYQRREAPVICAGLEEELTKRTAALEASDRLLFGYFYHRLHAGSPQSAAAYEKELSAYFSYQKRSATHLTLLQEILGQLGAIFAGETITVDTINATLKTFKDNQEKELKTALQRWNVDAVFDKIPAFKDSMLAFVQKDYAYFSGEHFLDNELAQLNEMIHEGWAAIQEFIFEKYKHVLEMQERVLLTGSMVNDKCSIVNSQ